MLFDDEEGVDADEALAEYMQAQRENAEALTKVATEKGWSLHVEIDECEDCGGTSIEEAWRFSDIGYVWADADGFGVMYDPDIDNEDIDRTCQWECERLEAAVMLVEMLQAQFAA